MLVETSPRGLVILSGDVHHAEISSAEIFDAHSLSSNKGFDKIVEITSSGLTHFCAMGFVTRQLCPLMLHTFSDHRLNPSAYHIGTNVGLLSFNWSDGTPQMQVQVFDIESRSEVLIYKIDSLVQNRNAFSSRTIIFADFPFSALIFIPTLVVVMSCIFLICICVSRVFSARRKPSKMPIIRRTVKFKAKTL